jgi:hypothetical protein
MVDPVLQSFQAGLDVLVIVHIPGVSELDLFTVKNLEQIFRRGVMDEPRFRFDCCTAFKSARHEDAEHFDNGRIPIFHKYFPWIRRETANSPATHLYVFSAHSLEGEGISKPGWALNRV